MYIELNSKKYSIDNTINGSFEPKISHLRKKNQIELYISLYVNKDDNQNPDVEYFKNLKELPNWLYLTNNYYWWIFKVKELNNLILTENKGYKQLISNFYNSSSKIRKRFRVTIDFEYTEIWGTNNRVSFDRELMLRNIIE